MLCHGTPQDHLHVANHCDQKEPGFWEQLWPCQPPANTEGEPEPVQDAQGDEPKKPPQDNGRPYQRSPCGGCRPHRRAKKTKEKESRREEREGLGPHSLYSLLRWSLVQLPAHTTAGTIRTSGILRATRTARGGRGITRITEPLMLARVI